MLKEGNVNRPEHISEHLMRIEISSKMPAQQQQLSREQYYAALPCVHGMNLLKVQ